MPSQIIRHTKKNKDDKSEGKVWIKDKEPSDAEEGDFWINTSTEEVSILID